MKTINKLILTLTSSLILACAASAAMTYEKEKAYIEAYTGRTDIPVPISVVAPSASYVDSGTRVEVRFTVSEKGTPTNISFRNGVDKALAADITSAVKAWKFAPEMRNGAPVARDVVVPFVFNAD